MGTSVDDGARQPNNWHDWWQNGKLRNGGHVQSFPRAFASLIDVPVRLLNQLTFNSFVLNCRGYDSDLNFFEHVFFFSPTKRLYKGRLLTKISASKELSNSMKFSSKVARNSRIGGRHLGEFLAACCRVRDINAPNLSLADRLDHSTFLFSSFRIVFFAAMSSCAAPKRRNKKFWVI